MSNQEDQNCSTSAEKESEIEIWIRSVDCNDITRKKKNMHQVGIDISKTKFYACLLLDENKTKAKTFGNSFEDWYPV